MLPVILRGARTHNLRGVDLKLYPGQLVALTGPSGAGKSSLAVETLYAEGQRRFVESFSPYARQFLERLQRPPVDSLDPVAAAVAVDRRAPVKSSRSTLATMADLEPYFAGLFAREAVPSCADCGLPAVASSPAEAARRLVQAHGASRATVSYALRVDHAEHFLELREALVRDGYRRMLVGGTLRDLDEVRPSDALAPEVRVEVVLDRLVLRAEDQRRLQQAIELGWDRGDGRTQLRLEAPSGLADPSLHVPVVRGLVCPGCARAFEEARPALFSSNSPLGACASCKGFGRVIAVDWAKVIPDPDKTLLGGAIRPWTGKSSSWERGVLAKYAKRTGIPMDVPWGQLRAPHQAMVLDGEGGWRGGKYPGLRAWFKWLETRTYKMHVRVLLSRYREYAPCGDCGTARLNKNALAYRVGGLNLAEWHAVTVSEARQRLGALAPRDAQGRLLASELGTRLAYLDDVGLGYLTLDRQARTLSGGEAQRAGLTTALGASLTGALFVLDEPTVGLHPGDVPALARAARKLSDAGNSVLVIEHDPRVVRTCDRVVEIGPGAGAAGGQILFDGSPAELERRPDLPTGQAWAQGFVPRAARRAPQAWLTVRGARANNLRGIDARLPLGVVCAITGPSGSGKSTLAEDVVYRGLAHRLGDRSGVRTGEHDALEGAEHVQRVCLVDQSPLGRTARGNAATYTKAWDRVRARFGADPDAVRRGLTASHFSFNVGGSGARSGRCEACAGEGFETVEMQFLADVSLLCAACQGQRFKPEVLAVRHRGKSIADVLGMTVDEAVCFFDDPAAPSKERDPVLRRALEPVARVGLGYLPLGQPLSTLSGGEAQRLKLARALSEPARGTLFVLDEPSAGLHARDTAAVVEALRALTSAGASVIVVEHDLDVVRSADWVVDLGPGAGPQGGLVVAEGTPEALAQADTRTGRALRGTDLPELEARALTDLPAAPLAVTVENAHEHNLKGVSARIPHAALTVVTGPSGSGKSSLAFDVVYAEGQRRFMETLTPYARQFLPMLPRPEVDRVLGVPPCIALEQRVTRAGANSTVATVTEAAHYLRLLYAKVGEVFCPACEAAVAPLDPDELFLHLTSGPRARAAYTLYAPAVRARKGTYLDLFTQAARSGITTARVDGALVAIDPPPRLAKTREHTIDLVLYAGRGSGLERTVLDRALTWGQGSVRVGRGAPSAAAPADEQVLSTARSCTACGAGVPELDPRWFSFNTRQGQCATCEGAGRDEAGVVCRACAGTRLGPVPRRVRLHGATYAELLARDVSEALVLARGWTFSGRAALIAAAPHAELLRRLEFIAQVGLGYLALDRPAGTLSGGEMQRLRLSAQLGSGLTGALYVLDEPTIGLHPQDTQKLLANLRSLVATGSTVVVVEHDAETIAAADHVLDLGPGGGREGGHIVSQGPAAQVLSDPRSPTARALLHAGPPARRRRGPASASIELIGAREHNLQNVTLRIPAGRLTVVAGVSGSGKSTLVRKVFYPALRRELGLVAEEPGTHARLKGAKAVARALAVDQSPIGRTPRSVPATFLGIWDHLRRLYAGLPEAKVRGFTAARFSFNTASGGRCPTCEGQGVIVAEMAFLPDTITPCEACGGARFEPATLDVRYNGRNAGDVLRLSADEAAEVFSAHPRIARPLTTLRELGVGYLQLGQGSNTLSGGEAQRLKLAAELTAGAAHEPTCYVLDEPTTGLHLSDVRRLITVLDRLVERGDTLVVIEHHPELITCADWVVELGPEGGRGGGRVVFEGEPAQLARARTPTGRYISSGTKPTRVGTAAGRAGAGAAI